MLITIKVKNSDKHNEKNKNHLMAHYSETTTVNILVYYPPRKFSVHKYTLIKMGFYSR